MYAGTHPKAKAARERRIADALARERQRIEHQHEENVSCIHRVHRAGGLA